MLSVTDPLAGVDATAVEFKAIVSKICVPIELPAASDKAVPLVGNSARVEGVALPVR